MHQYWLKGADGDVLNAVLCAAGFNVSWLLRAIAKMGLTALLLALTALAPCAHLMPDSFLQTQKRVAP